MVGPLHLAVLLTLLAASACAGDGQAANALVEYERSGGIAGFSDRLEVHPDGRAEIETRRLKRPKKVRLPRRQLRRLDAALRRAGFDELRADYGGGDYPDALEFPITYRGDTVRGDTPPNRLSPALTILDQIIDREAYAATRP